MINITNIIDIFALINLKKIIKIQILLMAFFLLPQAKADIGTAIGSGSWHSCAAMATGGVKCWGENTFGQLGDGTKVDRSSAVSVVGLSGMTITSIGGGTYFTCALTSTGSVYCWGQNQYGQLGNGSYVSSSTPVAVLLQNGPAKALSVGSTHACLVDTFGNTYCWGNNSGLQLDRAATTTSSNYPIYVAGNNDVKTIAGTGIASCLIDTNSGAKCFGNNSYAQLGIGNTSVTIGLPTYVTGFSNGVMSVTGGTYHACLITQTNSVACWGGNPTAQLGFVGIGTHLTPIAVTGIRNDPTTIAAGNGHTCITTLSGTAQCWGSNMYGQLGRGTISTTGLPADVAPVSEAITHIAPGLTHTCAITASGLVKCWGRNTIGQLGNGNTNDSPIAVSVVGL